MRQFLLILSLLLPSTMASGQNQCGCIVVSGNPLGFGLSNNFNLAYQGISYTGQIIPNGIHPPFVNFSVFSGSLPTGTAINSSTGAITGTPSVAGVSTFQLSFQDSSSPVQTLTTSNLVITIASLTALNITPTGQSIKTSATLQMDAVPTWSTGVPPSGPATDLTNVAGWGCTGTGCSTVSGTGLFTASGSAGSATINASFNGVNATGVTVTVASTTPTITNSTTLPNGQINQLYPDTTVGSVGIGQGVQMNATGGTPGGVCPLGYNWSLTGGTLPAGVTIATCGLLAGTPTASGVFSPQLQACDNAGSPNCTTVTFSLTIVTVASITVTPTAPSISVGAQQQLTATATYNTDGTTHDVTVGTAGGVVGWTHGVGANSGNTLSNVTTKSVTLNNVVAGSIIVCGLDDVTGGGSTETLNSVKDQNNNSYAITPHSPTTYTSGIGMNWVAYILTALTGTNTITGTWSASNFNHLGCDPFTPSGGTPFFDTDNPNATNAVSNTNVSAPSVTPTGSGELGFNSTNTSQTITVANSPWLLASGGTFAGGVANEYLLNSGSTAQAAGYSQTPAGVYSGITAFFGITPTAGGSGTVWTATDVTGKNVASVTASGLATCISGGTSTIKAAIGGVNGTITLTCNATATDTALIITPISPSVPNGSSVTYKVVGNVVSPPNDYTATSTFASDNVTNVSMNGAGPGNNIGTCKVGNNATAHISAQNPVNGGIGTGGGVASQTCTTPVVGGAALLTGCNVTPANAINFGVNNCPAALPVGWTLLNCEGFEGGVTHASCGGTAQTKLGIGAGTSISCSRGNGTSCSATGLVNAQGGGSSVFGNVGNFQTVYISYWEWLDANALFNDEGFVIDIRHTVGTFQEIVVDRVHGDSFPYNSTQALIYIEPQGSHFFCGTGINCFGSFVAYGAGAWHQWQIFLHFNTSGNSDGTAQVFFDGNSVYNQGGLNINGTINMAGSGIQVGGNYGKSVWTNNGSRPNAGGVCSSAPGIGSEATAGGGNGLWIGTFNASPINAGNCPPAPPTFNQNQDDVIIMAK